MLSLIVPLALGYLAVRAIASGRTVAAGFLATAVELAAVLLLTGVLCGIGSLLAGVGAWLFERRDLAA